MAKQTELVADLEAVRQQQVKIQDEVRGVQTESDNLKKRVAELEAAAGDQDNASPELVAAVKAVKEQAQALDDQIPDVPPGTPVEPGTDVDPNKPA